MHDATRLTSRTTVSCRHRQGQRAILPMPKHTPTQGSSCMVRRSAECGPSWWHDAETTAENACFFRDRTEKASSGTQCYFQHCLSVLRFCSLFCTILCVVRGMDHSLRCRTAVESISSFLDNGATGIRNLNIQSHKTNVLDQKTVHTSMLITRRIARKT